MYVGIYSLRAKSEFDRNTALHAPEDAAHYRPVHRVLQAAPDLLKVVFGQGPRDPQRFVQVRPADMEFGDPESPPKHGFGDRDGR